MRKEYYKNNPHPSFGKTMSEDTKEKIRLSNTGKKATQETKAKLSEMRTGKNHYLFGEKRNINSNYLGVYPRGDSWFSRIKANGESIYLGTYSSEIECAISYDKFIIENNLNNNLNFPNDIEETIRYELRTKQKDSSSYSGVYFQKKKNKWGCGIYINGKSIYLGLFLTEEEAAKAYDEYIIENSIQKPLNFPKE